MYEYNRDVLIRKLNQFVIDLQDSNKRPIIKSREILGIILKNNEAIIIFSNYLQDSMNKLNKVFQQHLRQYL